MFFAACKRVLSRIYYKRGGNSLFMKTPVPVYDVSLPIYSGMLVWPGDPPVSIEAVKAATKGDSSSVSLLHLGSHTGTHVDAPRHFIAGAPGVSSLDLNILWGKARLFQLPAALRIDRSLLERLDLDGVTRLLLGTGNSARLRKGQFDPGYVFVTEDAASYLVDRDIKLVGVDYLSIEAYHNESHPTHRTLLGAGVVIIEGLVLDGIPPGDYELICLPLKIRDGDGAPARVLLRGLE